MTDSLNSGKIGRFVRKGVNENLAKGSVNSVKYALTRLFRVKPEMVAYSENPNEAVPHRFTVQVRPRGTGVRLFTEDYILGVPEGFTVMRQNQLQSPLSRDPHFLVCFTGQQGKNVPAVLVIHRSEAKGQGIETPNCLKTEVLELRGRNLDDISRLVIAIRMHNISHP